MVKVNEDKVNENVYEILPNIVDGSIRKLNLIMERALILGAIEKSHKIDNELIMKASNDINLV